MPPCTILTADYLRRRRNQSIRPGLVFGHALLTALLTTAVLLVPHVVLDPKAVPPDCSPDLCDSRWCCGVLLHLLSRAPSWTTHAAVDNDSARRVWRVLSAALRRPDPGRGVLQPAVAAYVEKIERDNLQGRDLPVAVYEARRDVEYGLGFLSR